eukprot:TRINITY_DN65758_c4_g1_i1.p2 TRINITY_DN65758_c4_g1~~TRINITY_DN65758_c4_g1_i1.p2  ORF type:complete len:441 (+),score=251.21 TRINITY_DN65758_c4_g1_i1:61-1323(+)
MRFNAIDDVECKQEALSVKIDVRQPLSDLKDAIGQVIGVDVGKFRMRRARNDRELKDLSKPLTFFGLTGDDPVYVEAGEPLPPHHFIFCVFVDRHSCTTTAADEQKQPNENNNSESNSNENDERFEYLGDVVMCSKWDLKQVKQRIHEQFGERLGFDMALMRLRERLNNKLTRVWVDNKDLKANCLRNIKDYKPVVVQRTREPETLTDHHAIMYVARYVPKTNSLSRTLEVALDKTSTFAELKQQMVDLFDDVDSVDNVMICKPPDWQIKDAHALAKLTWRDPKVRDRSRIATWRMRDGDTILVRSKTDARPSAADAAADESTSDAIKFLQKRNNNDAQGIRFMAPVADPTQEQRKQEQQKRMDDIQKQRQQQRESMDAAKVQQILAILPHIDEDQARVALHAKRGDVERAIESLLMFST